MTDTVLLEQKISESGLKKIHISSLIGLSPYGLAKKITNETEFKTSEVNKLCEILGIYDLAEKDRIFFAK